MCSYSTPSEMEAENQIAPPLELEVFPEGGFGHALLHDDVGADDVGRHQGRELDAREEDRALLELEVLPVSSSTAG
jgi:hypothetical protein